MIGRLVLLAAVSAVSLSAFPTAAEDAGSWVRSAPADRSYSIETPCTAAEVAQYSVRPLVINDKTLNSGTNVSCKFGNSTYSSGVMAAPAQALGDRKLFDLVFHGGVSEGTSPRDRKTISLTKISGMRAVLSRETTDEGVFQTSVIELADHKLLFLVSGGEGASTADLAEMIDRHVESLKAPG